MSVATLLKAAEEMRRDVALLQAEIDSGHYYWRDTSYQDGVRGGLGGAAGMLAAAWHPDVALAAADLLHKVAERHAPVEWHAADPETGVLDPEKPLPPFCRACTDDEYVSAIEFGDIIDAAANVAHWPCPDADSALAFARAYLGEVA